MKILLTGSNGFFGSIIRTQLSDYEITSLDLNKSDIIVDLSTSIPLIKKKFDLVIHAAGRAHMEPKSKIEEQAFFNTNVQGTINLLKGFENTQLFPSTIVLISSVSVYGLEIGENISELSPLNSSNAYATSKLESERKISEWGGRYNVNVVILRLPLLVGLTAVGTLGSMIKGIRNGYYFRVGEGHVKKSMVLAEDVALLLPSLLNVNGIYNLTDGYHPTFRELDQAIATLFGKRVYKIPHIIAKLLATIGDVFTFFPINSSKYAKLSMPLTFNDEKARKELNWRPRTVLSYFNKYSL